MWFPFLVCRACSLLASLWQMAAAWCGCGPHEALRVFHDRLVDDADRGWFCNLLSNMLPKHLDMQFSDVFNVEQTPGTVVLQGLQQTLLLVMVLLALTASTQLRLLGCAVCCLLIS